MRDQLPGDGGAGAIEFGRAMRRFAEKDDARVPITIEKRAEFLGAFRRGKRLGVEAQRFHHFRGRLTAGKPQPETDHMQTSERHASSCPALGSRWLGNAPTSEPGEIHRAFQERTSVEEGKREAV